MDEVLDPQKPNAEIKHSLTLKYPEKLTIDTLRKFVDDLGGRDVPGEATVTWSETSERKYGLGQQTQNESVLEVKWEDNE